MWINPAFHAYNYMHYAFMIFELLHKSHVHVANYDFERMVKNDTHNQNCVF